MRYAKLTVEKMEAARARGAEIHECTNWRFTGKKAGYSRVERLAQTNGPSGRPKRIVWACYHKGGTP